MSVASFIPAVWDARLLEGLKKDLVYANLLNRNYEGEITAQGDTVHINSIGDITVKKYTKNSTIDDPETLTTSDQTLVINQADYFNFEVDDVDKVQARANLIDSAMSRASYKEADETDSYVAGLLKAGTVTTNLGDDTTPITITKDNAYSTLVAMKTALDKANVPTSGRWVVVPPDYEGFLLLDDRFTHATANGDSAVSNGFIGRCAGFDIYKSNNVPNTSGAKYKIIASTSNSATFADQILKTEAFRPQNSFSDAVKGLHVYGAKVTGADEIAVLTASF